MIANDTDRKLQDLCRFLEEIIRNELTAQCHIATGNLRDAIKAVVVETADGFSIEGRGPGYAKHVDWGRRPGGKRVPIEALLAWIRVKGISVPGKKDESLAWAIQYSIWKNGVPTNKDVNKTRFISKTLAGNKDKITASIREASEYFFAYELNNIIRNVKEAQNVRG